MASTSVWRLCQTESPTALITLYLHRVESRKLANHLLKLVESEGHGYFVIEGIGLGAPPEREELTENQ